MVMSPQVSWLFFEAQAKRPYLDSYGSSEQRGNGQPAAARRVALENGPAAALLVGYVSIEICALLAPRRRPILNATTSPLYVRRYTNASLIPAGSCGYLAFVTKL